LRSRRATPPRRRPARPPAGAFRAELARRLQTSYVEDVKAADVILQRRGTQVTAELAWERRLHMFGNMYILLEFEASSAR